MRPELAQFEQVESYISGSMSVAESTAYEELLANSPELQKIVDFQRIAIQAVTRKALRAEIESISGAGSSGFFKTWFWLIIALFIAGVIGALVFVNNNSSSESTKIERTERVIENNAPEKSEAEAPKNTEELADTPCEIPAMTNEPEGISDFIGVNRTNSAELRLFASESRELLTNELQSWIPFKRQFFMVNGEKGSTIEGNEGTLIIVPSDAFIDKQGKVISETVQLELIEVLKYEDMLAYNLTTMNDGKALSSGGMLYIQPSLNGEKVELNPERPLYIEIPTDDYNPEMMSWKGKVVNGDINWISPAPLKRFLTIVDLSLLDFIPEGFADEVEAGLPFRSHTKTNQKLVDSLYYSLALKTNGNTQVVTYKDVMEPKKNNDDPIPDVTPKSTLIKNAGKRHKKSDKSTEFASTTPYETSPCCYIDPLSIKTLRSPKFQNTFIATKEFEERLQAMHKHPNGQGILDVYLTNLDRDMLESDRIVLNMLEEKYKPRFQTFADQQATNVDATIYQDQLTEFYTKKRSEYKREVEKNDASYREKSQAELYKLKQQLAALQEGEAKQAGASTKIRKSISLSPPPRKNVTTMQTYATTWYTSGWMNIDAYLHLLEKGSLREVTIAIEDQKANAKIYQCIDLLKTILPLTTENNQAVAKFPNRSIPESKLMENSYCLAIAKNDNAIFYSEQNYNPYTSDRVYLQWEKVSSEELYQRLRNLSSYNNALVKSLKEEEERIARQLEILRKQEELKKEQERLAAIWEKENAFIQKLINRLDQCRSDTKNIPQGERLITPDGNGKDDFYFMNFGKSTITDFKMAIKNEKGITVYETNDSRFRWDGENLMGLQCPEGIYTSEYSCIKNGRKVEGSEYLILRRNGANF